MSSDEQVPGGKLSQATYSPPANDDYLVVDLNFTVNAEKGIKFSSARYKLRDGRASSPLTLITVVQGDEIIGYSTLDCGKQWFIDPLPKGCEAYSTHHPGYPALILQLLTTMQRAFDNALAAKLELDALLV